MPTTTTTATTSTNGNGSQRPQRPPEPPLRAKVRLTRTLLREPAPALDELRRDYGPVVGLTTGPMRMAVVGAPAAMREMFQAGADSYRWGHRFMFGLRFVVGSGSMIVSDGEAHKRRRRSAQGAFSRPRLDAMVPMILRRVDDAVDELARSTAPGAEIDLHPFGRHLIIGITLDAFFGPRRRRPRRRDQCAAGEFAGLPRGPGGPADAATALPAPGAAGFAPTGGRSTGSSPRRSSCAAAIAQQPATTCCRR
jgi:cytochrome P450